MADSRSNDETVIAIGDIDVIRWDGEWRFCCGCGDIVDFEDVQHVHCPNCWVTCNWCRANVVDA